MTPNETKELLAVLRASGVTHYKSPELELTLEVAAAPIPQGSPEPIKEKLEQMTSLLKLDDVSLVDRLFPVPEEQQGEAS